MTDKFEQLVSWYLRLNGYLTMTNFILHRLGTEGGQRGEVDVLGVRFPHSVESGGAGEMRRDDDLSIPADKIDFVIAEVKKDKCAINNSWKNDSPNWEYAVKWLGFVPQDKASDVAESLRSHGRCEGGTWIVRTICFGKRRSESIGLPEVVQVTFDQVITFMQERFREFRDVKTHVSQWDPFIREFHTLAVNRGCSTCQTLAWLSGEGGADL